MWLIDMLAGKLAIWQVNVKEDLITQCLQARTLDLFYFTFFHPNLKNTVGIQWSMASEAGALISAEI